MNGAINFNKTGSIAIDNIPAFGSNFVIDLWVKFNSLIQKDFCALFMRGNSTTANGVHIYGNKLGWRRNSSGGLGNELEELSNFEINKWYRLTFNFTNRVGKYYRDGILIKTINFDGDFNTTSTLTIGDWSSNYGSQLNGAIHDFKLFNRAFLDEELEILFKNKYYNTPFDNYKVIQLKLNDINNLEGSTLTGNIIEDSFDKYVVVKNLILHDGKYKSFDISILPSPINAIPIMITNSDPSGRAFGSSFFGDYEYFKAFDNNVNTSWISISDSYPHILGYEFPISKRIVSYSLQVRTLNQDDLSSMPQDWTFEGSDDGTNWTILDKRNGQTWNNSGQILNYTFTNYHSYKKYRIRITKNNGGRYPNQVSIGNFLMFSAENNDPSQIIKEVSSTLPTTEQFLSYGIDELLLSSLLNRRIETFDNLQMINNSEILNGDEGKVFSKTINLKKYIDIKSIKVEVE